MALRVALAGGGTGGHIYPIVSIAQELKKIDPNIQLLWVGSSSGKEREVANEIDVAFRSVPSGKIRRYFSLRNVGDILKVPFGILKAYWVLTTFKPHVLFSKGGYVSYPVAVAAWLHDIPILLHETDSVPGRANRKLASKATLIATSFPVRPNELPENKTVYTGNPIRQSLLQGDAEKARAQYGFDNSRPVLFVAGGSQGAVRINTAVQEIILDLLPHMQVIHQVGEQNLKEAQAFAQRYSNRGYRVVGFIKDDLADIYSLADIIAMRSGGQIFEIAALGKPAILLPLPESASDHQARNAFAFQKQGAAIMLEGKNITGELLKSEILKVFHDKDLQQRLGSAVRKFAQPLAASKITYWLLRLAQLR